MTNNAALAILNYAVVVGAYEIPYPVEKTSISTQRTDAAKIVAGARSADRPNQVAKTIVMMAETMGMTT